MQYTTIPLKEARLKLSDIIEQAAIGGQTYIITKFGKAKVMISPAPTKTVTTQNQEQLRKEVFGIWKDRTDIKDSGQWAADIRRKASSRYDKIFG